MEIWQQKLRTKYQPSSMFKRVLSVCYFIFIFLFKLYFGRILHVRGAAVAAYWIDVLAFYANNFVRLAAEQSTHIQTNRSKRERKHVGSWRASVLYCVSLSVRCERLSAISMHLQISNRPECVASHKRTHGSPNDCITIVFFALWRFHMNRVILHALLTGNVCRDACKFSIKYILCSFGLTECNHYLDHHHHPYGNDIGIITLA